MRTLCDKCNKEIDTIGNFKGRYAYPYMFEFDTEPHVSSACTKSQSGFLYHECSKRLQEFMKLAPTRQILGREII